MSRTVTVTWSHHIRPDYVESPQLGRRRLLRTGRSASCSCGWQTREASYDALDSAVDAHVFGGLASAVRSKRACG